MTQESTQAAISTAKTIAQHLASASFDDIPAEAIARAKVRLIDSIGNIYAGFGATGNDAARSVFGGYAGAPQARVFGSGLRLPAPHAALLNAMSMRSYDFEAVGAEAADANMVAAHISGTTVSVALAASERVNASGARFLEALILGEDLASRLAVASGFHTASGGDNTGSVNVMGGAAIVGKLEFFDVTTYQHAFGHALNQMAGSVQNLFDKASSFKLPQSLGARNAIVAADLAQTGFDGLDDAIGSPFGFFRLFSPNPRPDALLEGLGSEFYADMVIKPWSSCRAAHPALDGLLQVRAAHSLTPSEVASIEVHVTPTTKRGFTAQPFSTTPKSEVDGIFSIPYNLAIGLIEGTVRPEHLQLDYMNRAGVRDVLSRIQIIDSLPADEYQTAEIVVVTTDGRRLAQRVDAVLGDRYRRPLDDAAVLEKFRLNLEFGGLDAMQGERIIEVVERIETLDDVTELLDQMP